MNRTSTPTTLAVAWLALLVTGVSEPSWAEPTRRQRADPSKGRLGQLPVDDAEVCNGHEFNDELLRCQLVKALVDQVGAVASMTLVGSFCTNPEVFMGRADGTLATLSIVDAGPDFIVVELAKDLGDATSSLVVKCPCASCMIDVTTGTVGLEGPTGPTGPTGATGGTGVGPGADVQAGVVAILPGPDLDEIAGTYVVSFSSSFATVPSVIVSATSSSTATAAVADPVLVAVTTTDFTLQVTRPGRVIFHVAAGYAAYTSLSTVAGNPAIAYSDPDLKYVRATDGSGKSWGAPINVDAGDVLFPSLVVIDGHPAIAYYGGASGDLMYVRAADAAGTSWATPISVDTLGNIGMYASLAVVAGNPAIAYYDITNKDLKYVRATDAGGANWETPIQVDKTGDVGQHASLAVVAGGPAVAYHDNSNGNLKYVAAVDVAGTLWGTPINADTAFGDVGEHASLTEVVGHPAIAYYSSSSDHLRYVRATNPAGTAWGPPLSIDTEAQVGEYASLAVVTGNPAIAYYDYSHQDLKYVRALDPIGSSWGTPTRVDKEGGVGEHAALAVVAGNPAISYYDDAGSLKFVTAAPAASVAWMAVQSPESTGAETK
jgi:hypothetical protein